MAKNIVTTKKIMHTVTGAFGYSGRFIAEALLKRSLPVNTLTNSLGRESYLQSKIEASPLCFNEQEKLTHFLRNTRVLYNNYWVRFNHATFTHEDAVQNTFRLIDAAKAAGVQRFVHISITNPSEESGLEYFSGKARIEQYLIQSGLSYCILRPAVLFGFNDILINNISWVVRHFPVFPLFGKGDYRLQPIYVQDLAEIAVQKGAERKNEIINALGPETFTYRELIEKIARSFNKKSVIFPCNPGLVYMFGKILSFILKDTLITRDEIKGIMADLLYVEPSEPAVTGKMKLSEYIDRNNHTLGTRYASELARRLDRLTTYD